MIKNTKGEELLDLLSDPLFYENLANPQLTTEEDIENMVLNCQSLLMKVNILKLTLLLEESPDSTLEKKVTLTYSLLSHFLDFSGERSQKELREIVLIDDSLVLNLSARLREDLKKEVMNIARKSYKQILKKWKSKIDILLPSGFVFIKIFINPEEMHNQYNLKPETRGVAFPCRYIAVLLRFDSQGFLVREELKNTIVHELSHIFCYIALGFWKISNLSTWFHEGLALELSGQTRIHHTTQDFEGIHIWTISSTEEYKKYQRNFQFIKERYGSDTLFEFIRESILKGHIIGYSIDTLSSQSESWFKKKRNFELLMILITLGLLIFVNLRLRKKKMKKRVSFVIILGSLFYGSLTPYYYHSNWKYIFGFLIVGICFFVITKNIKISTIANAFLKEAERYEFSKNYLQSIILWKKFLKFSKNYSFLILLKKKKIHLAQNKIGELENQFFNQYMSKAYELEQNNDYSGALECYQKMYDNITYLRDKRNIAQEHIERIKLFIALFSTSPGEEGENSNS